MIKQLVTKYVTKITVRIHATRSATFGHSAALGPSALAQSLNAFCLRRTYSSKSKPSLMSYKSANIQFAVLIPGHTVH
jgi:hypothetical protein